MDRVRNKEVRRRAGIERELASRVDQRVLKWFGHVERIYEYRITMARSVDGRSKWRAGTRETEVRLDGSCGNPRYLKQSTCSYKIIIIIIM